jgi:UDP-N-acetylglucosamine acyltransferase
LASSSLNVVGMKRRNFSRARIRTIHAFYKMLFHGPGLFAERLAQARAQIAEDPAIAEIVAFIDSGEHRSLCRPWDRAAAP